MNLSKPASIRLQLLGPALALIIAGTMIPTGLRHPSLAYIKNAFDPSDIVNNILLYAPLGIALGGSSWLGTFLFGLLLSGAAETLQIWYVDRVPSLCDVASNTAGAMLGYLLARFLLTRKGKGLRSLRLSRRAAALAMPLALLGTLALIHPRIPSDFSNWSPAFHLAVGNELTGNRPWSGRISGFSIYPVALSPSEIEHIPGPGAEVQRAGTLVKPVVTREGKLPYGRALLPPAEEATLYQQLVQHNQMTLVAWFRTEDLNQTGPARIVTYSRDPMNRNFTLGQMGRTLTFRVRTPASGLNGADPPLYTGPVLSLNQTYFVAAVYDGRTSRLYLDGKLAAHADLGARRPRLPHHVVAWLPGSLPIRQLNLCGAEILLSALFAIGCFSVWGVPPGRGLRFSVGAFAGTVIGMIVCVFAVSDAGLCIRILLECVAAGLLMAASVENDSSTMV